MILGQVTFFLQLALVGRSKWARSLFFFVAWYEWARYDVGQLTRKNVFLRQLAHSENFA